MKKIIFAFSLVAFFSCTNEMNEPVIEQSTVKNSLLNKGNQNQLELLSYVTFDDSRKVTVVKNTYVTNDEYRKIKATNIKSLPVFRAADGNNYSEQALRIKDINPIYDIPEPTPVFSNCLSIAQKEMYQALANSTCKIVLAYCCLQTESNAYCLVFTFTPNNGCAQDDYDIYD